MVIKCKYQIERLAFEYCLCILQKAGGGRKCPSPPLLLPLLLYSLICSVACTPSSYRERLLHEEGLFHTLPPPPYSGVACRKVYIIRVLNETAS